MDFAAANCLVKAPFPSDHPSYGDHTETSITIFLEEPKISKRPCPDEDSEDSAESAKSHESATPMGKETVHELLHFAEEHQLPRLRHRCEDFLLSQPANDEHGLKVARRFNLGRLEERYRKRYAGGKLTLDS